MTRLRKLTGCLYSQMLEANKEQDPAKRYEKYADIQAWLIDSSLVLPSVSAGNTIIMKNRTICCLWFNRYKKGLNHITPQSTR